MSGTVALRPLPRAALCRALEALDASLRRHGSALVLRVGRWEEQLPALAAELGASGVLAEQEVETGAPQAAARPLLSQCCSLDGQCACTSPPLPVCM